MNKAETKDPILTKRQQYIMEESFKSGYKTGNENAFTQISFIMGYLLADENNFKKIIQFIEKDNKT